MSATERPEIAESWRRVMRAGLAPDSKVDRLPVSDFDRDSKLMTSASPVLDELTTELDDTSLCLLLADHDSRIVDARFTDRRVGSALEQISAVPGSAYSEEVTGTNAVATPCETRQGLLVNGAEHFLERLKKFSCYGLPIRHPLTRRLEGVLDITGVMPEANPLFVPFIRGAVRDIEQRLLDASPHADLFLLAAFQHATRRNRSGAVVVLDDELVLTNPTAADLLETADHAVLRSVAPDVPRDGILVRQLRLASGRVVNLEANRISGTSGMMLQLRTPAQPRCSAAARRRRGAEPGSGIDHEIAQLRGIRSPVLISGEPGTGRSHAVRLVAGDDPVITLDAADVPSAGEGAWGKRLGEAVATHEGVVAVEEIQLLPAALCVRLAGLLARATARFVLTSTPRDQLEPEVASLAASCVSGVELRPLRWRRDELPALAHAMLQELRPETALRFTPSALGALAAHEWPGNLRELAMVVRHAAGARSSGDITVTDLPQAYRSPVSTRSLTRWEQAEHDAITAALRATAGNKVQAAERLGISRTTLYSRIRSLKITF